MHETKASSRRAHRPAALFAALALLASACGGDDGGTEDATSDDSDAPTAVLAGDENVVVSDDEPQYGGRLVYGLMAEADGWNPTLSRWSPPALQAAQAMFDTITVIDAEGEWQPNVVQDLESSDDFMTWTITLRDGVTFHDGQPLDAEALAGHLNFIRESPLTELTLEPVESIEPVDGDVVVTMNQPWATFPYAMSTQIGHVAHPDWLANHGPDDVPNATGPFVPVSWQKDVRLLAERNDNYWREGMPYLSEIEFRPLPNDAERSRALRQGEVAIIQLSDAPELRAWREAARTGPYQFIDSHEMEMPEQLIMMNTSQPPFDNQDARLALTLATDRQQFLELIDATDLYEVANGPWGPNSPWYTDVDFPDYDPERAAELVEEIKAETGDFSFVLRTTPTPGATRATNALIEAWQEVGIDATLDTKPQSDLIFDVLFNDYQAALWRQFDFAHPANEEVWWSPRSSGGEFYPFEYDTPEPPDFALNFARIRDEQIGDLLLEVRSTDDRDEHRRLFGEVNERLNEYLPYIWLYHTRDAITARTDVVNVANWTTPDGEPGMRFSQGTHPVAQIWLRG
ncbi:MAG: ABC transporter substrate-binding protein [Acidimicrobiia bacterium]|nr:ABC transporter substrate-binding protein [Acidimicrobiia bacterium]